MSQPALPTPTPLETLYAGIRQLVEHARAQVLTQVNQALVLAYWQIGKIIQTEVLQHQRAQYGAGVLKQLAERLTRDYGSGFSHSGLTRMAKFYSCLPEQDIVATLSQQLSWSHFVELMDLEQDQIHVAEYWLQLPPREVLQAKLHKAMVEARARLECRREEAKDE